jgi:uncharacterized membrane protein
VPLVIFTAALPAFFASFVEFVEALTVVLAVGVTRGWRSAWIGTIAGVALLTLLVVGALLLLFGMRWLRKAILRYAGIVSFHDENAIYAEHTGRSAEDGTPGPIDRTGVFIAFNAVVLEGLEVVFIVVAVGASSGALVPAALGALVAGALVGGAGLLLRRPLARVPENGLKFVVGVMLSAFGTFWTGEGLGIAWPAGDFALLALVAGYALVALMAVALARRSVVKLETVAR